MSKDIETINSFIEFLEKNKVPGIGLDAWFSHVPDGTQLNSDDEDFGNDVPPRDQANE